ncbi:Exosome complex component RRP46 [Candida viswanathii]|uniref:Exosome complex component RRP46 n=1 Tax=Candida viswanathii TaxID=5486 RepID=A0A367YMY6_9ASCO|nr:Exosome complex component RRP46 [Candida viswanathii]
MSSLSVDLRTSTLPNADGSAELTIGGTKVITSISGPIEPKLRQELPNQSSLEIIVRPATGLPTTREKLIEDKLRSVLQSVIISYKYPRQLIQIVVQFARTDEAAEFNVNELNAAINSCYFALIDADVALYSSFATMVVAMNLGNLIREPSGDVLETSESFHLVCFTILDGHANKLLMLESQGEFTEQELFTVLSESVGEVEKLHSIQRKFIEDKIAEDYIWKRLE